MGVFFPFPFIVEVSFVSYTNLPQLRGERPYTHIIGWDRRKELEKNHLNHHV